MKCQLKVKLISNENSVLLKRKKNVSTSNNNNKRKFVCSAGHFEAQLHP
jgi:hypothetical protein